MPRADLVLLHAPSVYDFRETSIMYGPVSDLVPSTPIFEMYPIGFTTMAEYMERRGLTVRIVNLAVLMLNRKAFDVEAAIRKLDPVVFGIDLHWLPHAHGAIEVAKLVKKHHPDTPVVLGGLSSSFFHEELITYPCVDFVMRGDSTEEPMTRLLQALKGKGSVSDIPNLTWKTPEGSVVVNPLDWVLSDMDSISLDYSFNMRAVIRYRDMMGFVPFKDWLQYPVCAALTCRGCTRGCVTCGGSAYAFREHYGRSHIAYRDPALVVSDIAHIQRFIPGPIFVLGDIRQQGMDYAEEFVRGIAGLGLRNPIAFEFFDPPSEDFFRFLGESLRSYSVEISVESHEDEVRRAFGKRYTTAAVDEAVVAALANGCERFDLYFMTGIPQQTADSVLRTVPYVESLYDKVSGDSRLLPFISPMAPFLDPGSMAFDDPEKYGYRRLADTLEEHRQLLVQPSWKYIMNYESAYMSKDELVASTYESAYGLNQVKARVGAVDEATARLTEERILAARDAMGRVETVMAGEASLRKERFAELKREIDALNESTVCEKAELKWPARASLHMVINVIGLWLKENVANILGLGRAEPAVVPERNEA